MLQLFSAWLLPAVYATGFLLAVSVRRELWAIARGTALVAFLGTILTVCGALVWPQFYFGAVDKLGLTGSVLASLLGWVIINYSSRYLQGEPNQSGFARAMLFTLACVSVLIVSRHLLVIVLAWTSTSIGLHYLLTFYRERKAAQVVAHKKFIVSRLADVCLVVTLVLLYQAAGTLTLDGLAAYLRGLESLPVSLHVAAALLAMAAILKSAQLPLHGWLIQVMEAPTPVSALLHAGIVNIGGFVLIRLADLVSAVPAAQIMLVLAGTSTAVLAGLVMMTRISIKVRLAWSTCAQMGFMLVEVGLGLYELALLHLVAHSLYKAHAFLAAGDTVAETKAYDLFPMTGNRGSLAWYLGSGALSASIVAGSFVLWQLMLPGMNLPLTAAVVIALGLAPLLWLEQGISARLFVGGLLRIAALTQIYLVWHLLFGGLAPAAAEAATGLVLWVVASFSLLYVLQIWLRRHPDGRLAQTLYPWAYCGFYLDETFTRLTFKLWPARLSPLQAETLANKQPARLGEML